MSPSNSRPGGVLEIEKGVKKLHSGCSGGWIWFCFPLGGKIEEIKFPSALFFRLPKASKLRQWTISRVSWRLNVLLPICETRPKENKLENIGAESDLRMWNPHCGSRRTRRGVEIMSLSVECLTRQYQREHQVLVDHNWREGLRHCVECVLNSTIPAAEWVLGGWQGRKGKASILVEKTLRTNINWDVSFDLILIKRLL